MSKFSKRNGYHQLDEVEITVREDAPREMRGVLIQIACDAGISLKNLRQIVCSVLKKREDQDNWSDSNIKNEIKQLIDECHWSKVYDVIESIASKVSDSEKFEAELNEYFVENGIGWKLEDGTLSTRGPKNLEQLLSEAGKALVNAGLRTAANELHEAVSDLSRRPAPDITGAIQHAMASLECAARTACGDEKATLGDVIKRYPNLIPRPIDEAITKLWGFASENARHIREGREPTYAEAELVVHVAAAAGNYLVNKSDKNT